MPENRLLTEGVRERLLSMRDEEYRAFQCRLMPTVQPSRIIGVRTHMLRAYAKELYGTATAEALLGELPHTYYEEDNLHAYLIERIKPLDACLAALDAFLPYVDNWATCDILRPKAFNARPDGLTARIKDWMADERPYVARFGMGTLLNLYLDEHFCDAYHEWVIAVRSDEYYVNMMIAWYFATALTKQYERTLPVFLSRRLDAWTHNKAIQKAIESRLIPQERKDYLRTLKVPSPKRTENAQC